MCVYIIVQEICFRLWFSGQHDDRIIRRVMKDATLELNIFVPLYDHDNAVPFLIFPLAQPGTKPYSKQTKNYFLWAHINGIGGTISDDFVYQL